MALNKDELLKAMQAAQGKAPAPVQTIPAGRGTPYGTPVPGAATNPQPVVNPGQPNNRLSREKANNPYVELNRTTPDQIAAIPSSVPGNVRQVQPANSNVRVPTGVANQLTRSTATPVNTTGLSTNPQRAGIDPSYSGAGGTGFGQTAPQPEPIPPAGADRRDTQPDPGATQLPTSPRMAGGGENEPNMSTDYKRWLQAGGVGSTSDYEAWLKENGYFNYQDLGKSFQPSLWNYDVNQEAFDNPFLQDQLNTVEQGKQAATGRVAPQATATNLDQSGQAVNQQNQQEILQGLMARASGQQPGMGQLLANQATDKAIKTAQAMSNGARGNVGAAQRRAGQAGQTALLEGNQQASLVAAQEQQQAANQAANLATGARTQDIGIAEQNQKAANDVALANLQAGLTTQQQKDELLKFYENLGYSAQQAEFESQKQLEQLQAQVSIRGNELDTQMAAANAGSSAAITGQLINAGLGAAGGLGAGAIAASDENLKTGIKPLTEDEDVDDILNSQKLKDLGTNNNINIKSDTFDSLLNNSISSARQQRVKDAMNIYGNIKNAISSDKNNKTNISKETVPDELDNFLNALTAYGYEYKQPEKYGKGPQIGVMAQDLEKSNIGKSLVLNTPEGKMVKASEAFGPMMAGLVRENERINELDERLNKLYEQIGKGRK